MARKIDEYQPLKFYAEKTEPMKNGFRSFAHEGEFFFCRYADGQIVMLSQAYTAKAGRDNGIASVKKNAKLEKRYRFSDVEGGGYGFSLIAGNGQEIAISPTYKTMGEAEAAAQLMNKKVGLSEANGGLAKGTAKAAPTKKAAPKKKAPAKTAAVAATGAAFTASDGRRGNYKPLDFYNTHGGKTKDGFDTFEQDGAYYFSYREKGDIVLIGESYTTQAARDNGVKSVTKNMPIEKRYKHRTHSNGQHYFDLVAGNHQEIATSVWYDSDAKAKAAAASLRGEKTAPKTRKPNSEDEYQSLAFYTKATSGKPKNGIEKFKGEDGEYYFVYNENGKVALVSESYPTAAARDTGAKSVEKNISLEKRYDYRQGGLDGKPGYRLRAGNNKEIARSIPYASAAAATAGAAYLLGTRKRSAPKPKPAPKPKAAPKPRSSSAGPLAAAVGGAALAGAGAAAAKPSPKPSSEKTDDYLACEAYEGHTVTDAENRVALFETDGQKYFVFYDEDGDVRWRSEGFETDAARQAELDLAIKLQNNPDNIKRLERGDRYIDLLHDDTGREIARSCLCTVKPVVAAAPIAAAAAAAAPVAAAAAATGAAAMGAGAVASTAATAGAGAAATGGGIWGWLKWLLLALLALLAIIFLFRACSGDGAVPPPAVVNPTPAMVTCEDGSEAASLADCPTVEPEPAAVIPTPEPEPVNETAPAPAPQVSCWDGSMAANQAACPVRPTVTCWDGSTAFARAECPARPAPLAAPTSGATPTSGRLGFFNTEACNGNFKTVTALGTNPEYGDSHALTPSSFYDKLASRHALGGIDRTHLDALFRALGYSGGFEDASAGMFSNATLSSGTRGLLGFGADHGLQCAALSPTADRDLEAFAVTGANGRTVYFMKTCGNYFFAE